MKSFITSITAMLISVAAFSQKAKTNDSTTFKLYTSYRCEMHPQYVSNIPASCPVCKMKMNASGKEQMKAEILKLYTCPMPVDSIVSIQPGKCPKCNMELVEFKPEDHAEHH